MKKVSKSLFNWADALIIVGVITIIIAALGFVFSDDPVAGVLLTGFVFMFMSPVVRGFGVLVQNAEEELAHRFDVKLEKSDEEK